MRKYVIVKDELGQLCTYLLKNYYIAIFTGYIICNGLVLSFSLAGEAAYVALPLM
jgi:hypothetical protein